MAALLVAVYHVFFARVSGAVDVFFVVAGFLITTSLLRQYTASGRLDPARYFARLGKRLLPLALTVLAAVLVATAIWMPVTRADATYLEVAASALYIENWALAAQAVDYLAQDQAASPVQHFWAMSIQGQFYLIWFGLFAIAAFRAGPNLRARLALVMAVVFGYSFAYSIYLTAANQPLAYFHTGTRMWEFAAGGLLALGVLAVPVVPRAVATVGGWVGLALILLTGVVVPVSTAFPGYVALLPIGGAALILWCGRGQSAFSVSTLLGSKPLVFVGKYSYGLYLWHWPVLTFYWLLTGAGTMSVMAGTAIIGGSLLLSVVSTKLIEDPIRTQLRLPAWQTLVAGAAAAAVMVGASWVARPGALEVDLSAVTDANHPGAAALAGDVEYDDTIDPFPPVAAAGEDRAEVYDAGCHQTPAAPEPILCEYGDADSEVTVYLVGGSHSAHWFPAMEVIASQNGWRLVSITKSGCLYSTDPPGEGDALESCQEWNESVRQLIERDPPDLLVMSSTRGRTDEEQVPQGYLDRWRELEQIGVDVVAIRNTPRWTQNRVDCLALHGYDSSECMPPRDFFFGDTDPTAELEDPPSNVTFADLNDHICDPEVCASVVGNVVVYYDSHHLTATYVRTMAPMIAAELPPLGR